MNKNLHRLKNLLNPFIMFVLLAIINQSKAQTLQRQSIASCGTSALTDGMLMQQTIGQPYSTNTSYSNGIAFRPGFQQPVFTITLIHSTINLNVFPNPAAQLVTIQSQELLKGIIIRVVNIAGEVLIYQEISEFKTFSFNCENWANGIYMISVSDAQNNNCSSKLVILK